MELLKDPPKYFRAGVTRAAVGRVDRTGGYRQAGLIERVSVITRGEALGHGTWIDGEFLDQVAEAINMRNKGTKARFTHPGLSGDGLGRFLGRVMNAEVDGDRVVADLHFSESAHKTPDGDLAGYVMDMAEGDGDQFGLSIVFQYDAKAQNEFAFEHGATVRDDGTFDASGFRSPDPDNVKNYPHARLAELRAVDTVDEPAANPGGLFHRGDEIAAEATNLAAYALGRSAERPKLAALSLDADRVRDFVARYLEQNNLTIGENTEMEQENEPAEVDLATGDNDSGEGVGNQPAETPEQEPTVPLSEGARFLEAFGDKGGVWFAQGKTFAEASELHAAEIAAELEALRAENADLQKRLAAKQDGEESPLEFSDGGDGRGFATPMGVRIAGKTY